MIIKYIIIYLVCIILFIFYIVGTKHFNFANLFLNVFNIKIKIKGKNNLQNYNKHRYIIMSNHVNATDYAIIVHTINFYTNKYKNIYTVIKHDLLGNNGDKNNISKSLGMFKDIIYEKLNFIPYKRGDKISGEETKNRILELIDKNNILLFPEGECTKSGIPVDFKPGSFKLCSENNIYILPISLEYHQDIGVNRHDKIDINKWFNISVTIHIHEPIINSNWEKLKNNVLQIIKSPLK